MIVAVQDFITNIATIEDPDYGDFMRKANIYFNDLKEHLKPANQEIRNRLAEMQLYIQYVPTWRLESTREKILRDAHDIEVMLEKEKQKWESVTHAGA